MVDINDTTLKNIESILKQNFSRIPVYDDDKDNVISIPNVSFERILPMVLIILSLRKILQEFCLFQTIFVDDLFEGIAQYPKSNGHSAWWIWWDVWFTWRPSWKKSSVKLTMRLTKAIIDVFELRTIPCRTRSHVTKWIDFNRIFWCWVESDDVDTIAGYPTEVKEFQLCYTQLWKSIVKRHLILTNDK